MKTRKLKMLGFIVVLAAAVSCSPSQGDNQQGSGAKPKPYKVMTLASQSATLLKKYPTTLQGKQTVEIRPKVPGYIEQIYVDEGAYVKKGQTLFRLNANDIQAQVRSAEAQVKVAEAQVNNAKINLGKTEPLVEKDIISKYDLQSSQAALASAEAQLAQARANVENAKANLQYTLITCPTDGIIGTFPYRVGSLVSSSITQPLTTVSNTSSMYAYFSMNEKDFLQLTKNLEGDNLQEKLQKLPPVSLILADNSEYDTLGKVETASGLVDIQTGSINIRATFPNDEGILRNGSSGQVVIPQHFDSVLLVPQKATYELQGKHFVYVVGEGNNVKNTEIEIMAGNLKEQYIVISGLKEGEQIVIEGVVTLRDNTPIEPHVVENEGLASNGNSEGQVKN